MKILRQCQDKQEWNDFVLDHGGHPLQLWGWGELKSLHGWQANRLYLMDDETNEIFGGAQVIVRDLPFPFKSLAYIPRGPIVDKENRIELLEELAKYIKETYGSIALEIEPDEVDFEMPSGWIKAKNSILPSRTIILDLKKNESELLADMDKNTRQLIRKSAAESVKIKSVKNRLNLEKCLDLYHDTNRHLKFAVHSDQYYFDVYGRMEEYGQIFAAFHDGSPIAFLWIVLSGNTAYELYGGANQLGRELDLAYSLKWHAILKCREWGIKRYDLGGISDDDFSAFKKGWSSSEINLVGTFDKPLSIRYGMWTVALPRAKKTFRNIKSKFKK